MEMNKKLNWRSDPITEEQEACIFEMQEFFEPPLPKYIDADALKAIMVFSPKLGDLTVPEMRNILTEIDSVPVADVEPVRHAQWIPGREIARTMLGDRTLAVEYSDFHCSSCGQKYKEYVLIYKYCPNCGAKMEKGRRK